jgi:hypothetical protein
MGQTVVAKIRTARVRLDPTDNMWGVFLLMLTFHSTMIQVLLHFLIFSLPTPPSPSDNKRKRRRKREDLAPDLQEAFDMLTDRLCIWRDTDFTLSDSLTDPSNFSERDWLQAFCEDVVRPAFEHLLPPLFELFRIKCFPESVGENDSESETDPIFTTTPADMNRASSRSRQLSAEPSAASSSFVKLNQSITMPRHRSGSTGPSESGALSMLPPRTFSRSNSVASTSNNSSAQLLNSRREVSMRRSVSVQRDVGAGVGLKGKERERQQQGAKRTGNGGDGMTALSSKGGTRAARSSSFSFYVPHDLSDHQQPKRSATTLVPETPLHGGRQPSRLFGRAATLNDLGRTQVTPPSQFQTGLSTFNDNPSGRFSDEEDSDNPGGDVDGAMGCDEPEQAPVLDAAGLSRGRTGSVGETVILVQSSPLRPRARSTGAPLAASEGSLDSLGTMMIPETPAR